MEHKSANLLNNSLPSAVKEDPKLGDKTERPAGTEKFEPKSNKRVALLRAAAKADFGEAQAK
jgi:hypothetical protein